MTGLMSEFGIKLNWRWPPIPNKNNIIYTISIAGTKK